MNNKGFAITGVLYSILILFIVLVALLLFSLQNKKKILDTMKENTIELLENGLLTNNSIYRISYEGIEDTSGLPTDPNDIQNNTITLNNKPYDVEITRLSGITLASGTDYTYDNTTGTITFSTDISDSITISAIYSITYNLNSGTNSANNPATYKSSDLPITLHDGTKDDQIFSGWYETSDFSDTHITSISNRYENITLYAKWVTVDNTKKYSADCLVSLATTNAIKNQIAAWNIQYEDYTRYDGSVSNEWLILYFGQNTDSDIEPKDNANHIVLMTKYIAQSVDTFAADRTTANSYLADSSNWEDYTKSNTDFAYGSIKSTGTRSALTDIWAEINYRWLSSYSIFKMNSNDNYDKNYYYAFGKNQLIKASSGNSEYEGTAWKYGTRPMVYLGTDKKISKAEGQTYYGIITEETSASDTCSLDS